MFRALSQVFSRSGSPSILLVVCAIAALWSLPARAEYPERPITIIVSFAAGGASDIAARLIASQLTEALGKPVVVENRGGAGGNIGIGAVARSVPDGHTLLFTSSAYVVNPSLFVRVPYDPYKDFIPLMVIGESPNSFVVPSQSAIKSLPEFIEKAKANPGKLNWTSPGIGTTPNLAGEMLKERAGIDMVHIPFAGGGPANAAVLAGQIDLYVSSFGSITALVAGGKLRTLAVAASKRWPEVPDVPTLNELGIGNAESGTFQALLAPAGVPKPIVERLVKELTIILARPDVRETFLKVGIPVLAEGPDVFRARIERELPMWKNVVEKAGLKVN